MAFLNEQQKQRILQSLTEHEVSLPCSRCGNNNFSLLDGLASIAVGDGKTFVVGGQTVPAVVVICTRCGAVYHHALGVLGLFEELGFK